MPNNACYAVSLRFRCEALLLSLGDWVFLRIVGYLLNSDKTMEGLEKAREGQISEPAGQHDPREHIFLKVEISLTKVLFLSRE